MDTKSILILSTIKTSDVKVTYRFSKEFRSIDELLNNLGLISNHKFFLKNKISKIIVLNSNVTSLSNIHIEQITTNNKNINIEFDKLLSNAEIINCNDFSWDFLNCWEYFSKLDKYRIVLYDQLLDFKLLTFLIRNHRYDNVVILSNKHEIYEDEIEKRLKAIVKDIISKPDILQELDIRNYYEKYLIDLIEEKGIKKIQAFLKDKKPGQIFYIYGEDEELLLSIKSKIRKEIIADKLSFIENFNSEMDEIPLNDYILIELGKEIDITSFSNKILTLITNGNTFFIIDKTKYAKLQIGIQIYVPNYKELERYHSSIFIYFFQNYISNEATLKYINEQNSFENIFTRLNSFKSVIEITEFLSTLSIDRVNKLNTNEIEEYLLNLLDQYFDGNNKVSTINKVTYKDGKWEIFYESNTYNLKEGNSLDGMKLITLLLAESIEYKPGKLRSIIQKRPQLDEITDFNALRSVYNTVIKKIKEIEITNKPTKLLSDYLSSRIKFPSGVKKGYIIKSINVQKGDWKITLPQSISDQLK